MPDWHLYILRTGINTLYTGITTDVQRRISEHASGRAGAKYLRAKTPLELTYQVVLGSRGLASRAEYQLKQLSRDEKQRIIDSQPPAKQLLQLLDLSEPPEETS